jgi:hypothetical protein
MDTTHGDPQHSHADDAPAHEHPLEGGAVHPPMSEQPSGESESITSPAAAAGNQPASDIAETNSTGREESPSGEGVEPEAREDANA